LFWGDRNNIAKDVGETGKLLMMRPVVILLFIFSTSIPIILLKKARSSENGQKDHSQASTLWRRYSRQYTQQTKAIGQARNIGETHHNFLMSIDIVKKICVITGRLYPLAL
jgi:hypothetical protein